jgi:hypothetical protein
MPDGDPSPIEHWGGQLAERKLANGRELIGALEGIAGSTAFL